MINVAMAFVVVFVLACVVAVSSSSYPRALRPWLWFAFVEYVVCGVAQLIYSRVISDGSDALFYAETGTDLAKFLDNSFGWASGEILAMLFQRPCALDTLILVPGSNTASMSAVTAFLVFFFRGSDLAAHFFVTGMSLFASLSIYKAANEAYPGSSVRMFVATVVFPSVAFWTSALHKEAFALAGIGALFAAWRAMHNRKARALVYAPLGVTLLLLFRAPALVPVLVGLVVFIGWDRLQRKRGADVVLIGPVYIVVALGAALLAMTAVSHMSPELGLDRLGETVATKQQNWSQAQRGSSFATEGELPQTIGAQLTRLPLALINALFRPQLFDVRNPATLISAVEMTAITYLIYRAVRHHGLLGTFTRIQRSPFALMCAIITIFGCMMVGLVTLNFGSLARYRVPFLPFYGALLVVLSPAAAPAPVGPPRLAMRTRGALRPRPARVVPRRSRPLA